jgi:hypothetical protein
VPQSHPRVDGTDHPRSGRVENDDILKNRLLRHSLVEHNGDKTERGKALGVPGIDRQGEVGWQRRFDLRKTIDHRHAHVTDIEPGSYLRELQSLIYEPIDRRRPDVAGAALGEVVDEGVRIRPQRETVSDSCQIGAGTIARRSAGRATASRLARASLAA